MKKFEALLDGIAKLNGCPNDPESDAYKLRNPLLVKSFALPGKHEINESGYRIFPSLLNGYKAALFDLELKLTGKSRARVKSDGTLAELLACYEIYTSAAAENVISFVRRALKDQTINMKTPVSYFLEEADNAR